MRPAIVAHELSINGLVRRATRVGARDLAILPRAALQQPFICDEGWVVPSLRWSGVWLSDVLSIAEPSPEALFVRVGAGAYAVPLALAEASEALLADTLDDRPLGPDHGAPWRLVLRGGACYTSVKWVDRLELVAEPGAATTARG
jgi:DMSO/TMAO reductase YedYZ molybdopterin-dependent catalytic subunit